MKKDVDPLRVFRYTVPMIDTHTGGKMQTKQVVNSNRKSITVDANGWAVCGDCGGEYHPDDMKYDGLCFTCHNDIHCDDWTLDDC